MRRNKYDNLDPIERLARKRAGAKLGWGIGLAVHGIVVFVLAGGAGLHERMVQAERERIARQAPRP